MQPDFMVLQNSKSKVRLWGHCSDPNPYRASKYQRAGQKNKGHSVPHV